MTILKAIVGKKGWRCVYVVIVTCFVFCLPAGAADREYIVAAALNRANLNLSKLECISISQRRSFIFGESYSADSRVETVARRLFSDKISRYGNADCPFALLFNILLHETKVVKYFGRKSTVLMSFDICEQDSAGRVQNRACLSKNLYLFERELNPLEALELGLKAFLQPQESEWAIMRIKLEERAR